MLDILLQPFHYNYMVKAIWVSAIVGAACAFLSAYLMLKGWSLMGDALSHSVVPASPGLMPLVCRTPPGPSSPACWPRWP